MKRSGRQMSAQGIGARMTRGVVLNGVFRPLINHYVHPEVSGLKNLLELEPPFLLAPNHSSHMDTPLLLMSLPPDLRRRTVVAAATDYFYSRKVLGAFVSMAMGAVPMERRSASLKSMDRMQRLLADKWCVVMFPEGSRTPDGRLYRGKTGIGRIALKAGVPVVPVGITGTYEAMPGGQSWPVPAPVHVRFGKPLSFERYALGPANQLVLRAIADMIMYEIMELTGLTYVDKYASAAKQAGTADGKAADKKPADKKPADKKAADKKAADKKAGPAASAEDDPPEDDAPDDELDDDAPEDELDDDEPEDELVDPDAEDDQPGEGGGLTAG